MELPRWVVLVALASACGQAPKPRPAARAAERPDPDHFERIEVPFDGERITAWLTPVKLDYPGTGERVTVRWAGTDEFAPRRVTIMRTSRFIGDNGDDRNDYTLTSSIAADVFVVLKPHESGLVYWYVHIEKAAVTDNGEKKDGTAMESASSWKDGADRLTNARYAALVTPRGQVAIEFTELEGEEPAALRAFESVLRAAIVAWPEQPVGLGSHWSSRQPLFMGAPEQRHEEVEIVSVAAETVTVKVKSHATLLVGEDLAILQGGERDDVVWRAFRSKHRQSILNFLASTHVAGEATIELDRPNPISPRATLTETKKNQKGTYTVGGVTVPGSFVTTLNVTIEPRDWTPPPEL